MNNKSTGIDWEKARAQLAIGREALEKALETNPERTAEILRQRAAYLAQRRRKSEESLSDGLEIQTFGLGDQTYGLELAALLRILPFGSCTPVPGAPPEVLGLINFQGDIRVVFDLRLLLGLAGETGQPEATPGYLLWVKNGGHPVGLRVPELGPVRTILPGELEGNSGWSGLGGGCEKGITRDRVVILDEEKISQRIQSERTND